jgi:lycopene beta-cyclase
LNLSNNSDLSTGPVAAAEKFDYLIAGAGCAGLSLAMHMISSGKFSDRKILLVDKESKESNDRTWCYWTQGKDIFDPIVYRQWENIRLHGEEFSRQMKILPYKYKMIRGIDFYDYCFEEISRQPNFSFIQKKVDRVFSNEIATGAVVDNITIHADYIFNSIVFETPVLKEKEYWLLQHFRGWVIQTEEPCFDVDAAVLMDFRTSQKHGTAFCYVLPLSEREALVEYTLFSTEVLAAKDYDDGLRAYITDVLKINSFKRIGTESGIIPMTNYQFPRVQNNIINIGTAGGQTKASSGYTFNFIQKHSAGLVSQLIKSGDPFVRNRATRFFFYDGILLRILKGGHPSGREIFTDLFRKNDVLSVLRFLDNETRLIEELKIISSLPTLPFLKAAIKHSV